MFVDRTTMSTATIPTTTGKPDFNPYEITRPHPSLLPYYLIVSVLTGPGVVVLGLLNWFKYETLKYKFEPDGMSISWGLLFRRETYIAYRRIQDIHLTRNILQRWMGLATVSVQTAAGSVSPEMTIEGILEADELRDFLYAQMRGARGLDAAGEVGGQAAAGDGALALLREIRDLMRKAAGGREQPV